MKRLKVSILLGVVLPVVLLAGIDDWFSVVRVKNNYRQSSFAVMTNEEYTKMTKTLWDRNRVLGQALRLARDEWAKADDTKDKVFPVNITCKAEVKRIKTFPDVDQANAHATLLEEKEAASLAKKKSTTYLEKRIAILEFELDNRAQVVPSGWVNVRRDELAILLKERAERQAKDRLIKELEDQANGFIEDHIVTLLNADPKQTGPLLLPY
jgi:hypothetical protein